MQEDGEIEQADKTNENVAATRKIETVVRRFREPPSLKVCGFPTNTVLAVHRYADNFEEVYRPLLS